MGVQRSSGFTTSFESVIFHHVRPHRRLVVTVILVSSHPPLSPHPSVHPSFLTFIHPLTHQSIHPPTHPFFFLLTPRPPTPSIHLISEHVRLRWKKPLASFLLLWSLPNALPHPACLGNRTRGLAQFPSV